jgi:two-component system sensor histidine kinase HydH
MKIDRSFKILAVLIALALALALALAFLFVRQVMERNRARMEFQVYRVMMGILDEYSWSKRFNPADWPGVNGFGLYDESGASLARFGTAPDRIAEPGLVPFPGVADLSGSSLTIVRRTGGGPGMRMSDLPARPPRAFMRDEGQPGVPRDAPAGKGSSMGMMRHSAPLFRGAGPLGDSSAAFVFIDHGVALMLRQGRLALAFVSLFLAFFFAIVGFLLAYARRVVVYRERERETAQLVQLGEAARTLAHEIKNPLGVIAVQCATLRRTLPEERVRNLGVIEEETGRLALLTDRLRDFLSSSAGNPEARDPATFLASCAARYEDAIAVVPYGGPTVSVMVDPARMTQVLDNLIANAREAMGESGRDGGRASDLPELSLSVKRGLATFSVADRGPGVAEDVRARLFEPFFTTKTSGTGIGLALSRRFMEQAGGSLSYQSRPGGGSVFSASLPARRGA